MYIIKEKSLFESLLEFTPADIKIVLDQLKRLYDNLVFADGTVNAAFIYKIFNIYKINTEEEILKTDFSRGCFWEGNTKDLEQSNLIKLANEMNPVAIRIVFSKDSINAYARDEEISFTISPSVIKVLLILCLNNQNVFKYREYSLSKDDKETLKRFLLDRDNYETVAIHEISHWLDFTINKFVKPKLSTIKKITNMSDSYINMLIATNPSLFETLDYYEINAQMHVIKYLKNKHEKEWDSFSIFDLVSKDSTLQNVFLTLSGLNIHFSTKWIQTLVKRMSRENLLGKNMTSLIMSYDRYRQTYIDENHKVSLDSFLSERSARN